VELVEVLLCRFLHVGKCLALRVVQNRHACSSQKQDCKQPANARKIVMRPFLAVPELLSAGMSWLALENHLRHGLFRRMRNADRDIVHAKLVCDFACLALQL
jgi:hypothetical protein